MTTIEARGLRKAFGTTVALDGIDLHIEEGRILGLVGPNGAGKTTALNAILGLTSYQGELKVLGTRPMDAARRAHARCLFHCRCRRAATLDSGYAAARLCRRRASAIRSREGGEFSGQDHDQAHEQGEAIIERDGSPTASRAGHGDRREITGAGRADAWPGHPLSQTVLRFIAERLLRSAVVPSS